MLPIPLYISAIFGITVMLTIWFFYRATGKSKKAVSLVFLWAAIQSFIGYTGFYTLTDTTPPRFLLLVLPPILLIASLFIFRPGKKFLDSLDDKQLTLLHVVRIPVEMVLFWLFVHKQVPELMTFEGRNFDILSGLSAPFVFYFGYIQKKMSRSLILLWNVLCIGLLINIVANAIFAAPFPFQQFAFDQPNVAVLYFPFNLLPAVVVPLVLFSHLASIRLLFLKKER